MSGPSSPRTRWEVERRLQEHLDARRDPLDDPALVAWLEAHPEELEAFADLLATAPLLAGADHADGRGGASEREGASRRPRRWLPIAAAAALLFAALLQLPSGEDAAADPDGVAAAAPASALPVPAGSAPRAAPAPPREVLRASIATMRWTPESATRTEASTERAAPLRRVSVPCTLTADSPRGVLAATVTVHRPE